MYSLILDREGEFKDVRKRKDFMPEKFGGGGKKEPNIEEISTGANLLEVVSKMLAGEFKDVQLIGKGGMGSVFSARHVSSDDKVAIKVLAPNLANKETIRTRFYRESVAISNLNHPNICRVREVGKGHLPFYVMEFIDGMTLKGVLKRHKEGLGLKHFFALALPIVDALAYAHRNDIVHRDIKPENIMIDKMANPKLLDFGLVKFQEPDEEAAAITQTGESMGTPMYMSPEQLEGEEGVDARSDVYSIGLVFYEMLSLQYPFESKVSFKRVLQAPIPFKDRGVKVPAQLERVLANCMERDPEDRPYHGEELQELLVGVRDLILN